LAFLCVDSPCQYADGIDSLRSEKVRRCERALNRRLSVVVSETVGVVQAAAPIRRIQQLLNEFYGFFPCYRYHGLGCDQVTKA